MFITWNIYAIHRMMKWHYCNNNIQYVSQHMYVFVLKRRMPLMYLFIHYKCINQTNVFIYFITFRLGSVSSETQNTENHIITRMHSSRMPTASSLTVCHSRSICPGGHACHACPPPPCTQHTSPTTHAPKSCTPPCGQNHRRL